MCFVSSVKKKWSVGVGLKVNFGVSRVSWSGRMWKVMIWCQLGFGWAGAQGAGGDTAGMGDMDWPGDIPDLGQHSQYPKWGGGGDTWNDAVCPPKSPPH